MRFQTLQDVLVDQLADLHNAETQLVVALPKMARAAHSEDLREAFDHHLGETKEHVRRLDEAMKEVAAGGMIEECEGMRGLIAEGDEVIEAQGDAAALDAALIAAAQRVEHYEIAAYGTAKSLAGELGYGNVETLLGQTLEEESKADKLLTKIAAGGMLSSGINKEAASSLR
jgi:ferritin-like metal-binding protein YciE